MRSVIIVYVFLSFKFFKRFYILNFNKVFLFYLSWFKIKKNFYEVIVYGGYNVFDFIGCCVVFY